MQILLRSAIFLIVLTVIPAVHGNLFAVGPEVAKKFTVSGHVNDGNNGEALVGATIFVAEIKTGTVTDVYGNYSVR